MKIINLLILSILFLYSCKQSASEEKADVKTDNTQKEVSKEATHTTSFKPQSDFTQLMMDSVPAFSDMNDLIKSKKSVTLCGVTSDAKEIKGWPENYVNPATPCADFFGRVIEGDVMFLSVGISQPRSYDNMLAVIDQEGKELTSMTLGGGYAAQHGTMSDNPDDLMSVTMDVITHYQDGTFIVKSITTESGKKGTHKKEEVKKFKFNPEGKKFDEIK